MPAYRLPSRNASRAILLLAVFIADSGCGQLLAAEAALRLFAAGAAQRAILRLEASITTASEAKLDAVFDTVGVLRDRVLAGEAADVTILSEAGVAALQKAGKIAVGSPVVDLGSISVALAVRRGAPVPDVGSPDALKQALLSAKSVAYADPARGATAGAHFAGVLEQLGIAAQIKVSVTVLPFGGDVIEDVARGRFEIGVSQSSEIVAHPGVALVGSLPAPYAHRTRYLAAKLSGAGTQADRVLAFLQAPAARSAFAELGFDATQP